jgi:hypothetical protein
MGAKWQRPRAVACAMALVLSVLATHAQSYQRRALGISAIRFDVGSCGYGGTLPRCDTYSAGTDVWIGVGVANISDRPITYRNLRWDPSTVLEVRDESGNLVPETEELQKVKQEYFHDGEWIERPPGTQWWRGPLPNDTTVLQPGGQLGFSFLVSKYYDVSRPGRYFITAKIRSSEPTREWFYSNEIRVTVIPKAATQ